MWPDVCELRFELGQSGFRICDLSYCALWLSSQSQCPEGKALEWRGRVEGYKFSFLFSRMFSSSGERLLKGVRRPLRGLPNRVRLAYACSSNWAGKRWFTWEWASKYWEVSTCLSYIYSNIRKRPLLSWELLFTLLRLSQLGHTTWNTVSTLSSLPVFLNFLLIPEGEWTE